MGFKYICEHMRSRPVIIGGEESGGLSIGGHIPEKDGILADLLVAEMRAVWDEDLSTILDRITADVGPVFSRRIDLSYPDEKKTTLLKELAAALPETVAGKKLGQITNIDGVKFVLKDDSWFLIRPSELNRFCGYISSAESDAKVEELPLPLR